jgi:hypothetical protein
VTLQEPWKVDNLDAATSKFSVKLTHPTCTVEPSSDTRPATYFPSARKFLEEIDSAKSVRQKIVNMCEFTQVSRAGAPTIDS